jgi:hypothetical protein
VSKAEIKIERMLEENRKIMSQVNNLIWLSRKPKL